MKQMTCKMMGGPCDEVITGGTAEEMVSNGMAHVTAAHPDMGEKIKTMTKEETDQWMMDFQKSWDGIPDVPPPTA